MKISVVGCGYLGAVHAASMAQLGHDVVGIDVDLAKVEALQHGKAPFYEPGFDDLLTRVVGLGAAAFSADVAGGRRARRSTSSASGRRRSAGSTPPTCATSRPPSSRCCPSCDPGTLVVGKSTVPVGTAARLAELVAVDGARRACWPGTRSSCARGSPSRTPCTPTGSSTACPTARTAETAHALLDEVYAPIVADGTPKVVTDYATAEMVKTAANSFLATKISFINAMAELCEATGADVKQLADAIGYDDRIGRKFLNAGLGFGGGCLPKDIRAFMARAGELGADQALTFLREVDNINMRRRIRMVELAREVCDGSLLGKRIAVLGRGVQAEQRRHPRLAGAERGRAAAAAGRDGAGDRPGGGGELPADCGRSWTTPTRRRTRPSGPTPCCC